MSKHDRKLNLLTGIPADLIELCAAKRIKLLAKMQAKTAIGGVSGKAAIGGVSEEAGKKNPFFHKKVLTVAIAAVLLLSVGLSAFFLLFGSGKQIPVYLGMTVSSDSPLTPQAAVSPFPHFTLYDTLSPQFALLAHKENGLHDNRPNQKPASSQTMEKPSDLDPQSGAKLYYANQNEDLYITIHIDNPDKFEILSFTLNGEKYSSYMFEPGSDMENLILRCNVGNAVGVVEYTIDAIKYVDGTEIKDVRMDGDRTIRVGVYTEVQPTVSFEAVECSFSEIALNITVDDAYGILSLTDSDIQAYLCLGEEILTSQPINVSGTTALRFTDLNDNTSYRIVVFANYDAFDGEGKTERYISEYTLTTATAVTIQTNNVSYYEATYQLIWNEDFPNKTALSFALYRGEDKICDLNADEASLTDLLSDTEYTLKAEFKLDDKIKTREVSFITKKVPTPQININNLSSDLYSASFTLSYDDPLNLIEIEKIELLKDNSVVRTIDEQESIVIDNLELLQYYNIRVSYSYDLLNGDGKQTESVTQKFTTQSKGLQISDGIVVGIGTCKESTVYVNMPIGRKAFANSQCSEFILGDGVLTIGEGAFMNCHNLKEFTLPPQIDVIPEAMFKYCDELTKVTLHDNLKKISGTAFFDCRKLQSIIIPSGVTEIGKSAIYVAEHGIIFCQATEQPATWDTDWKAFGSHVIIWDYKDSMTDSQGVTYAVLNNDSLIAIDFNNSTRTVVLPDNVIAIADYAFSDSVLKTITIPSGVKSLGHSAFSECKDLQTVHLSNGLISIGDHCFFENISLKSITLPDTVTSIGSSAFAGCSTLPSVRIPEGVTEISGSAFWGCTRMKSISLPSSLTAIRDYAFALSGLRSIELPDNLRIIEDYAFSECPLLEQIVLPKNLHTIGEGAFQGTAIYRIVIPKSVQVIGNYILGGIDEGYNMFVFCEAPAKLSEWQSDWCAPVKNICWDFKEFKTDSQGITYAVQNDGKLCVFDFDDSTQTVTLPNTVTKILNYAFFYSSLRKITIPSTVTSIGDYAFSHCTNLETVILNEGLTTIGSHCFEYNHSLSTINLPKTLESLGAFCFASCLSIESIVIPEGIKTLESHTFSYCTGLSNVVLPQTLIMIDYGAFIGCKSLQYITLPERLNAIGVNAFMGSGLKRLIIPMSVTQIHEYAIETNKTDVYCRAKTKPSGWHVDWGSVETPSVTWGYTGS